MLSLAMLRTTKQLLIWVILGSSSQPGSPSSQTGSTLSGLKLISHSLSELKQLTPPQVSSSRPTTPTLAWCMLLGKGMEMSDIMKSSTRPPGSAILASSYQGRLRKGLEYYQRGGWTCSRARCSGCTSYTLPRLGG